MTTSTRKIGNVEVSPIGYGAMGISAFYGTVLPDEDRLKVRVHSLRQTHIRSKSISPPRSWMECSRVDARTGIPPMSTGIASSSSGSGMRRVPCTQAGAATDGGSAGLRGQASATKSSLLPSLEPSSAGLFPMVGAYAATPTTFQRRSSGLSPTSESSPSTCGTYTGTYLDKL